MAARYTTRRRQQWGREVADSWKVKIATKPEQPAEQPVDLSVQIGLVLMSPNISAASASSSTVDGAVSSRVSATNSASCTAVSTAERPGTASGRATAASWWRGRVGTSLPKAEAAGDACTKAARAGSVAASTAGARCSQQQHHRRGNTTAGRSLDQNGAGMPAPARCTGGGSARSAEPSRSAAVASHGVGLYDTSQTAVGPRGGRQLERPHNQATAGGTQQASSGCGQATSAATGCRQGSNRKGSTEGSDD